MYYLYNFFHLLENQEDRHTRTNQVASLSTKRLRDNRQSRQYIHQYLVQQM